MEASLEVLQLERPLQGLETSLRDLEQALSAHLFVDRRPKKFACAVAGPSADALGKSISGTER